MLGNTEFKFDDEFKLNIKFLNIIFTQYINVFIKARNKVFKKNECKLILSSFFSVFSNSFVNNRLLYK